MKAWFAIDPCDYRCMDSIGVSQFKDPNHTSFLLASNGVSFHKDPKYKKQLYTQRQTSLIEDLALGF
ncbi:hypothetical protein [Tychonema sp. BBK16]|uniref:hypothetical protein n=1 Tax=Tychonema sp. BBK16 TaxID=2699888 RepID=UPI001F2D7E3D|nr:hypothetical protein [Tychonema sp. BBK16]MCF6374717.1 hypothetical protein [Tychonema sp. BBK16]